MIRKQRNRLASRANAGSFCSVKSSENAKHAQGEIDAAKTIYS